MGNVNYANQSAIRNKPVTDNMQRLLSEALAQVYGPGYTASIYSGGQEGDRRTGSVRHDHGRAADLYVFGPDGKKVSGDTLAPLGQFWAAKKYGGVGMEMHGGGIHLDEWATPPKGGGMTWNYAKQGGQFTDGMRRAMDAGLAGQLPGQMGSATQAAPQSAHAVEHDRLAPDTAAQPQQMIAAPVAKPDDDLGAILAALAPPAASPGGGGGQTAVVATQTDPMAPIMAAMQSVDMAKQGVANSMPDFDMLASLRKRPVRM